MSAIAIMAEWPKRVMDAFIIDTANEQGVYGLVLYKNGIKQVIIIDDYIACNCGEPAFAEAHGNELWVMLMEKAWAKMHGSYLAIRSGWISEALYTMTGAPYETIENVNTDGVPGLFEKLYRAEQKNYAMGCGLQAAGVDSETADESLGLVYSHAYSIMGVARVKDKLGLTVDLVKLRNPWGELDWTGAWSDNCSNWTPQLEK